MTAKNATRPKKKPRVMLREDATITSEFLREVMQKHVINARWKMPSAQALETFASILEFWRGFYWVHQNVEPLENEAFKFAEGLGRLLSTLRRRYVGWRQESRLGLFDRKIAALDLALGALPGLVRNLDAVE